MDRCLPTRVLGLISRQPGVLLPPPINEIYGTLRNTRPRKRRSSIDNRSEFAERLPNLTRHRFTRFSSVHRATKLDSRTMQHASDTLLESSRHQASGVTSKAAMRGQCKTGHARKLSGTRLFYSAAC